MEPMSVAINLFFTALGGLPPYLLLPRLVPMKHPWIFLFVTHGCSLILYYINFYQSANAPHLLISVCSSLGAVLLAGLFARPQFQRGCWYMALFIVSTLFMDAAATAVSMPLLKNLSISSFLAMKEHIWVMFALKAGLVFLFALVNWLTYRAIRRWSRDRQGYRDFLLLLPLPVSQLVVIVSLCLMAQTSQIVPEATWILILAIAVSAAADAAYLLMAKKAQRARALQEQMALAEQQLNAQSSYYRQLQDNITQINGIRHDLNNQLRTAYALLERGESESVRRQLDVLSDSIRSRVGSVYCENLTVDAVLTEKANRCREAGIRLEAQAILPASLPIEGAHLCSAVSNILDNSIAACAAVPADERVIRFSADVRAGCLLLRCANPAAPAAPADRPSGALPRHGLGLGILKKLAALYDGSLETSSSEGSYETSLILHCRPASVPAGG